MKICIVWKNDYPWDVRIEKFVITLKEAAHDIYLLCTNSNNNLRNETINGIHIRRLPFVKNRFLNDVISSPYYFNPFWLNMINRTIKRENVELLIVRDLPLILIGLLISKKYRLPIILDMAENYPAMYWQRFKKGVFSALKNWFIKNPYLISWVERYAAKKVNHLFVVVNESADRLIAMGIDKNKISIVSNTPDLKTFIGNKQSYKKNYLQMIYVGFIQEGRGLDTVIHSLSKLKGKTLPIKFVVIGDGNYLNKLKELVIKQDAEKMVEFMGWIKNTSIPKHISTSDIGVIPHQKTDHTDTTIPNKLFDFMACGLPVIVSDANPMKRIVNEEHCGLVFKSGDPDDFCQAVMNLIDSSDKLIEIGANGRRAVERQYNWEADSITLKKIVDGFRKY
jgi:glycosyltransferase involved in cell wall biosynthesis